MTRTLLLSAAVALLTAPAFAADLAVPPPAAAPPPPFTWTGCYGGAHVGGAMARKDITDPVQLAQDSVLGAGTTAGVTTVNLDSSGAVAGAQIGCNYQFYSSLVLGVEGAVSGSTVKSSTTVAFPAGLPGDAGTVSAKTDFIPSVTARFGFAVDRLLFYGKGGVAWAGNQYNVVGSVTGTPFSFQGLDTHTGFTVGGGVDWAFYGPWSVNVEYDYYQFGHGNVFMTDSINAFTGLLDTKQSIQVVKVGLNFHVWSWDWDDR
jgi:outer membrane immunogenic protein